jgi:four helix bundle protein
MKIRCFEDLECWQEARRLTRSIYDYAKRPRFAKDFKLAGQICGAAISVMNNICEGFDAQSNKEFVRFLTYSRRSCSEVQNCLYVAMDQGYISEEHFQQTYPHCAKIRKMIDGLIRYLKQHENHNRQTRSNRPISPSKGLNRHNWPNRLNRPTGQTGSTD